MPQASWGKVVRFGEPGCRLPVILAVLVEIFSWMGYYSLTGPAEHKSPVEQHITGSLQLSPPLAAVATPTDPPRFACRANQQAD